MALAALERSALWAIVVVVLVVLGTLFVYTALDAAAAADHSAHAALAQEICDQLAAVPPGQPYPASLTDLKLTYPDGGDASLMERFEYHSTGATCTLKTEIVWGRSGNEVKVIDRSYPDDAVK